MFRRGGGWDRSGQGQGASFRGFGASHNDLWHSGVLVSSFIRSSLSAKGVCHGLYWCIWGPGGSRVLWGRLVEDLLPSGLRKSFAGAKPYKPLNPKPINPQP